MQRNIVIRRKDQEREKKTGHKVNTGKGKGRSVGCQCIFFKISNQKNSAKILAYHIYNHPHGSEK